MSVGIDNNVNEEKRRNHISIKDPINYLKTPSREKPQSRTHLLFVREITGEKKRNITTALYNGTHNSIIY